jgi:hypothetical protein
MSVHLSAHISAAPSGQIYLKFDITDFHGNMLRYSRFVYNVAKILLALHEDLSYVVLLLVTWSHCENTLLKCLGSLWCTDNTWTHHSVTLYVHCVSCPDCKFLFSLWLHSEQSITTGPAILQEADAALRFILHVALCYSVLILTCECYWYWVSWLYVFNVCIGNTIKCQQLYLYCWTWADKILALSTWVHCVLENVTKFRIFWYVYEPYSLHVWLLLIQI